MSRTVDLTETLVVHPVNIGRRAPRRRRMESNCVSKNPLKHGVGGC